MKQRNFESSTSYNTEDGNYEQNMMAKIAELDQLKAKAKEASCFDGVRTTTDLFKLFLDGLGFTVGIDSFMKGKRYLDTNFVGAEFQEWYQCLPSEVLKEIKHLISIDKINNAITKILTDSFWNYMDEKYKFLSQPAKEPGAQWAKLKEMSGFSEEALIIYEAVVWKAKKQMRTTQPISDLQVPMPILYTPVQEMGKTYFNRQFRGVIGELSDGCDFKQIEDPAYAGNWGKTIIGDFDEMKGLTYKNIESVKAFITDETRSGRAMYKPTKSKVAKMTICIASSNRSVAQTVPDTTGSRRFWEEKITKSLVETVKEIDFVELWREVDDTKDCRYHDPAVRERIRNIQLKDQKRQALDEIFFEMIAQDKDGVAFVDESKLDQRKRVKPGDSWGSQEFWNMYRSLGEVMGFKKPLNIKNFKKELKFRYDDCVKFKETNKKNMWVAIESDRWEPAQDVDEVKAMPDEQKNSNADAEVNVDALLKEIENQNWSMR